MRLLGLYTDAYGGYGGIAAANRHFLSAVSTADEVDEIVCLPRLIPETPGDLPASVDHDTSGVGGKGAYLQALLQRLAADREFDLVWCGHIHLVPLALLARRLTGAPVLLHIHGIDAWTPTDRWLANRLVSRVDHFISVSEVTRDRFTAWSGIDPNRGTVIPNTIDFDGLSPGPPPKSLLDRYDLHGKHVLMTMGRLVGPERKKGFDRVLEVLPTLAEADPDIRYLIVGKGPDRPRLEAKADRLGVADRVILAGYVPEEEKADHFRLADRFVLPSEGEGFGLVLLESLACGTPVIASNVDGGREAVAGGRFGMLVDPTNDSDLIEAIQTPPSPPPASAVRNHFGPARYRTRVHRTLSTILHSEGMTA
jgi:glycosyltransferase involved in cell wall biosynthesis